MKSSQFIDMAIKKEKLSRYKLAQKTGISDASLSRYKSGDRVMDDYACFKIAEILCIDPKKIIVRANAEREKDEEKKEYWNDKVKELGYSTWQYLAGTSAFCFASAMMIHIFSGANNIVDKMGETSKIENSYLFVLNGINEAESIINSILC